MMGDLKKRANFARVVNYVNNPKKARKRQRNKNKTSLKTLERGFCAF